MKYVIRFLAIAAAFIVVEEFSYESTKRDIQRQQNEKTEQEPVIALASKSESVLRVTGQMRIYIEETDSCGTTLSLKPYWNVKFVGMSKKELEMFLENPSNMEEEGDKIRGYYGCEIKYFDRTKLCIRKIYKAEA